MGCRCAVGFDVLESSLCAHSRQLVVWLDFVLSRAGILHDLGIHRSLTAASNRKMVNSPGMFEEISA